MSARKNNSLPIHTLTIIGLIFVFQLLATNCGKKTTTGPDENKQAPQPIVLGATPWPVTGQDMKHTGSSPYSGPDGLGIKWELQLTSGVRLSSPVLGSDETIYVSSYNRFGSSFLYAINPNGTLEWTYTTSSVPCESPVIDSEGTIYITTWNGKLTALNKDGSEKWRFSANNSSITYCSAPAIGLDGTVYAPFGSWGDQTGILYSIKSTGKVNWFFETILPIETTLAISEDSTIYLGAAYDADGYCYAINVDGTLRWRKNLTTRMIYSPAIGKEGIIYTLDTWGNIVAFNPDGSRRWETSVRPREWGGVPAIPTGDFALGADETLYAVVYQLFHNMTTGVFSAIRADGSLKWTINADSSSGFTGASLDTDGYIYVVSVKRGTFGGTIPGDSSKVIALNPDGTLKWEYKLNETGGEWWSSPVIGLNKTMYITTGSGKLYALR